MRITLLALLLVSTITSYGQNRLSASRKSSVYTYIYKIRPEEAWLLARSEMQKADGKFLHTVVDSFRSGSHAPFLKDGNYLFVHARENQLVYESKTIGDLHYKLVNNNRDFVLFLHSKDGAIINDAKVYLDNKPLDFDQRAQAYLQNKKVKKARVKIYYHDVLYSFPVDSKGYNYYHRSLWQKVSTAFPLKYVVGPIKKLFKKSWYRHPSFNNGTAYEKKFGGFMVFSKPKYKPGDTVRMKAFVTARKGKPVAEELLLRLSDDALYVDTIIASVKPFRKGAYEYSFVLSDSLDLDLDEEYKFTLEEKRSRKYDLASYDGDLDEDEYAAKRKVVMRGEFYYEEYELESVSFSARTDKSIHNRGEEVSVFLQATDENGMAVLDGRVKMFVTVDASSKVDFGAPRLFIADTLWYYESQLDPVGETKIVLPDSLFPDAAFKYRIECIFLGADNEIETESLYQSFNYATSKISFEQQRDSLKVGFLARGTSTFAEATITAENEAGDTILSIFSRLPLTIRINPFAKRYNVNAGNINSEFVLYKNKAPVTCLSLRTRDSIKIIMDNPNKIPVWYTIFANKKMVYRGFGDSLNYMAKTSTPKYYFVSLQYLYGGHVYNEDYTVPYQDKLLQIETEQPQFIYPGQTATININVRNSEGKAVSNADVTAYSFTKKFEDAKVPYIPYLGKYYKARKRGRFYRPADTEESINARLDWQRWSREMHLDTTEYYKFLHPEQFYVNTEPAKDSITQIAPFIVKKGDIQPIHQIYIDEVPVFFSRSQQLQRYSFRVSPGKHSFRFRTTEQMISLDSFWVGNGVKTFLSINADTSNKMIRISKMPEYLTTYEKNLWSKYMILVENNFRENYATIQNGENIYLINGHSIYSNSLLVGPLPNQYAELEVKNGFDLPFEVEGGYQYTFREGLVKQKQVKSVYPFTSFLSYDSPVYDFSDFVLTIKEVNNRWQDYLDHRSASEDLFTNNAFSGKDNGRLWIRTPGSFGSKTPYIKNILVFRKDDPDFLRVYKGSSENLGWLQPGFYSLFFLLKGDNYFIVDSINVKKNGINFYETGNIVPKLKDSVSIKIWDIISKRPKYGSSNSADFDIIKESFYQSYIDSTVFTEMVKGTIRDKYRKPIPAVTIYIKGTRAGTTTNGQGQFRLNAPPNATLVISSIGFVSRQVRLNDMSQDDFTLEAETSNLNEVVVMGYSGTTKKSKLAYATSSITSGFDMLQGRVPGVMIRGSNTIYGTNTPLYVIDGLPVDPKTMQNLDESEIENISVLKDDVATALYGSRAVGGAILITTKKGKLNTLLSEGNKELNEPGNTLRRNFKDAAYWQPRLRTDANGKASFSVTFPDDITNWRTFVIAATDKKQTGFSEGTIKSFKALNGNISIPQFVVAGDSLNVIGKVLNYLPDSTVVKRSFSVDDVLLQQNSFGLRHSRIDTFGIVAGGRDSVKLKYTIEKDNGYFDGEERSIPVFKQGVKETSGFFAALNRDTTVQVNLKNAGKIKIYAEASVLHVFERESEKIRNYEYQCNEQLASKLKAWLVQKTIDSVLKRTFKGDRNIKELVNKLNQNRAEGGLWGWWKNNEPAMWISLHVMEAMTKAQLAGYETGINRSILIDYLIYNLESYKGTEKISSLDLLHKLKAKVDFRKYTDTLERYSHHLSMFEKLKLAALKQELGMPVALDTLKKNQRLTMFGNVYWGDDSNRFFDNSIQNTLLVYRLFKASGENKELLLKIRNYFLEKRRDGNWRNTYESSLVLETILPDILVSDSLPKQSSLTISGQQTITINKFPFAAEINEVDSFIVSKQGSLPIYFSAYEEHWNSKPVKVDNDFIVSSVFEKKGQALNQLKGGEPVDLKINVHLSKDADYVMIEIPVPAGCSYKSKAQSHFNNEVHREYFKNKVSIFCSSLKKGDYTFTVSLLPRYSGHYSLNPAKAELMYFPVFFGREGLKKISIQ